MQVFKNNRRNVKSKKGPEATKTAKNEPVWIFDEDNDPLTTVCQELTEAILINNSVDMSSYMVLVNKSSADINKSDVCLLILSALTRRIGMRDMSNRFLAESDTVAVMFNQLNLNDAASLDMFATLIGILAPETLKSIETAMFASMRRISAKTTASHSMSRITSAMRQASESGLGEDDEFDTATVLARAAPKSRIKFVAQSMIEGIPEGTVNAEDSISVRNMSPPTRRKSIHVGTSGMMLDEESLRRISKESPSNKFRRLREEHPTIPELVTIEQKADTAGLGFKGSMSVNVESSKTRASTSKTGKVADRKPISRHVSEKMTELQAGLLHMQLDENASSDEEQSLQF